MRIKNTYYSIIDDKGRAYYFIDEQDYLEFIYEVVRDDKESFSNFIENYEIDFNGGWIMDLLKKIIKMNQYELKKYLAKRLGSYYAKIESPKAYVYAKGSSGVASCTSWYSLS